MKIPEYLLYPGITEEKKNQLIPWIEEKRKEMRKTPAFETEDKAISAAVQAKKKDELASPSVWKEPEDIGRKYAVVETELREDAQISGYTETVDEQKIHNLAYKGTDEIEEV